MLTLHNTSTLKSAGLLSQQESQLINLIFYVFLCSLLCVFGIITNFINTGIFFKQGFAYTMNISLCGLSVSDLCYLISQLWTNICFNPLLQHADIPFVPGEVQYLTGCGPAICFSRINGWITVFITAERCLGIALPLKVKQMITPYRTALIIVLLYIANMLAVSTEYFSFYLDWAFYPQKNRTLYGITRNKPNDGRGIISYSLSIVIGFGSFVSVFVLTTILAVSLERKSAWRMKATLNNANASSKANRDRKTVKMVVLIATVMIICCTPFAIVQLLTILEPEISLFGKYENTLNALLAIGFFFQNINSSINIFLYYIMSSKYRQTYQELFPMCFGKMRESPKRKWDTKSTGGP